MNNLALIAILKSFICKLLREHKEHIKIEKVEEKENISIYKITIRKEYGDILFGEYDKCINTRRS